MNESFFSSFVGACFKLMTTFQDSETLSSWSLFLWLGVFCFGFGFFWFFWCVRMREIATLSLFSSVESLGWVWFYAAEEPHPGSTLERFTCKLCYLAFTMRWEQTQAKSPRPSDNFLGCCGMTASSSIGWPSLFYYISVRLRLSLDFKTLICSCLSHFLFVLFWCFAFFLVVSAQNWIFWGFIRLGT